MEGVPPPAGWYPVGDSERYWDGRGWTDRVRAPEDPTAQRVVYDNHGLPHLATSDPVAPPRPMPPRAMPPPSGPPHQPSAPYPRHPYPQHAHRPHPRAAFGWAGPTGAARAASYRAPGFPVLASWFFPGLGTAVNGEVFRGVAIFVCWIVSCGIAPMLVIFSELGFAALLVPAVVWGFGLHDGWKSTERRNHRHGWGA